MKKVFLLILVIGLIGCHKKVTESKFKGFGEFLIGANFDSIPSSKLFSTKEENHFTLDKFELSKEYGVIESVEIETRKGRILEVNFTTGKYSNSSKLASYLNNLKETDFSKWYNKKEQHFEMRYYETIDGRITLETMFLKDPVYNAMMGYSSIKYKYYDTKIVTNIRKREQATKDSIEKTEYFRDVKKSLE